MSAANLRYLRSSRRRPGACPLGVRSRARVDVVAAPPGATRRSPSVLSPAGTHHLNRAAATRPARRGDHQPAPLPPSQALQCRANRSPQSRRRRIGGRAEKATVGRSAAACRRGAGAHMAALERRLARAARLRHAAATASATTSSAASSAATATRAAATCAAPCAAELIIRVGVKHDRAAACAAAARLEAAPRRSRQRRRQRQLVERRPCRQLLGRLHLDLWRRRRGSADELVKRGRLIRVVGVGGVCRAERVCHRRARRQPRRLAAAPAIAHHQLARRRRRRSRCRRWRRHRRRRRWRRRRCSGRRWLRLRCRHCGGRSGWLARRRPRRRLALHLVVGHQQLQRLLG